MGLDEEWDSSQTALGIMRVLMGRGGSELSLKGPQGTSGGVKRGNGDQWALGAGQGRHFSRVRLCATPETAARQVLLSMRFSRQEY